MRAVTKITFLDDNNEKFFGEGPARLLHGIEAAGSLRAAAMSMGMAYTLQIVGQKHLESSTASLLMSMESVFAVLFGWMLLNERLTPWEATGCVLVFIAVILSQLPDKKKAVAK